MTITEVEKRIFEAFLNAADNLVDQIEDAVSTLPKGTKNEKALEDLSMEIYGLEEEFKYVCENQIAEWNSRNSPPPIEIDEFYRRYISIASKLSYCSILAH